MSTSSTSSCASSRSGERRLADAAAAAAAAAAVAAGCSSLGRPSEAGMTATQGATTAAGAGGRSPPFRGRTMKEYEEMLAQLRKENFNLKLRLYFLEERGGAVGDGSGGEAGAAVRAELEQLRREAAEKQQLLCEAARAVELLEEQHHEQLRAARAAAHQAQAEAQHARAAAAAAAADAQRARQEADAEAAAAREAAAKAAAEAAAEAEQMRLELRQAREAALEAAEAARAARAVRASPSSPTSSAGGGSGSPENARLRGAVERAQAQLSALEGELGAVRAELRRQTEARAAAERGLAEGRAVHAKSLQTVQALARLCKERDREAEGLRARLRRERSDAAGADEEAAPRSPSASPSPPPPSATSTPPASPSPRAPPATPPPSPADPAAAVTLRRRTASSSASLGSPAREDAAVQADDPPSGDAAVHANVTLREVEMLQARAREQEAALAARDEQLRAAEERARRLEEELAHLKSGDAADTDARATPTPTPDVPAMSTPTPEGARTATPTSDAHTPTPTPPDGPPAPAADDEKDRLIARLSAELRRRTANLQELVNKELWDKNRQIERLQARLARLGSPATLPAPAPAPPAASADKAPTTPPPASPPAQACDVTEGDAAAPAPASEEDGALEAEEAALRRQLAESVRERACLAAQLEELRRRVHDATASASASASDGGGGGGGGGADAEVAATREALARAEAGRRDALAACAALARRLEALARALPPLLRRHRPHDRRSSGGGGGGGAAAAGGGGGGGGGGGRRLRALERALSAAARAARALANVEGAAPLALPDAELGAEGAAEHSAELSVGRLRASPGRPGDAEAASPLRRSASAVAVAVAPSSVAVAGAEGAGAGAEAPPKRVSESEVDAWSEPDRAVSMARVGLSPLSDRRAAAAAAAAVSASSDDELDDVSATGRAGIVDPYTSDDTIDSCADKLVESEGELHRLRSRVADLETRVCEKDNELLEQQCTLLEMRNTYTARCMEAENQLSELLAHVRQVQADAEEERQSARNQREAEAERRWRLADAALLRQRDAAAVAQSRAALERTQLMSERLRLERALRREEAAAAAAARAHRHERRQLHDQILGLQLSNRHLARRLDAAVSSSASPSPCPSRADAPAAGPLALVDHALGVCPLGASSSIASGLDGESIVSGSPPGSPWLLPVPSQTSLPAFSRQHSQLSGYASGECGPTSPLAGSGVCSWNVTRPPGEPTHGAGSPDLGIESDAGRFSSLEPLSSHCGSCDREGTRGLCGFQGTDGESEYARLQKENSNLKRNLSRTKKLLEATVTQLSSSNQLKRQMELAICKQLNKTQNVLKQAKGECEVSVEPVK